MVSEADRANMNHLSVEATKPNPDREVDGYVVRVTPHGGMRAGVADALSMRGLIRAIHMLKGTPDFSLQDRALVRAINMYGAAAKAIEDDRKAEAE